MVDSVAQRVVIFAPIGRDGQAIADQLQRGAITASVCRDYDELSARIATADVAFVAEEGLFGHDLPALVVRAGQEQVWSDFPFIVLTSNRDEPRVVAWRKQLVAVLGNVTLLERPIQPISLISVVRSALRARERQYQVRSLLLAREAAAAELEDLVVQRTSELVGVNRQLRREMSERAKIEESLRHAQKLEALGQLTGGVAHDFNNLLMVITAGLDMLERQGDAERRARTIDRMRQASQRGSSLTRQLLAFSRRHALRPEKLDISTQLHGMQELLDRSLRGDVNVELDLPADLWPVEIDSDELELALLNLAVNARDAMPDGGTISIRGENVAASSGIAKDYVKLTVTDAGTGMEADVLARIFEPFFTTKEVGKGSGLGLAHVYGFASQSGGMVDVTSEVGVGTTVNLFLPRADEQADSIASEENFPASASDEIHGNVLLVEDDEEVAALVSEMLEVVGLHVQRMANAEEAIARLNEGLRVDLVFSDFMMPGGTNGIGLARQVRERMPELPVLLTSGYAEAARDDAAALDVSILEKPYTLSDLRGAIVAALHQPVVRPS